MSYQEQCEKLWQENIDLKRKLKSSEDWLNHYKNCIPLGESRVIEENLILKKAVVKAFRGTHCSWNGEMDEEITDEEILKHFTERVNK
jgi:hypothetical protein